MTLVQVWTASDLVLRTGRLAFTSPDWTPAKTRRAALRTPAGMAPDADELAAVVGAIHHASDALARLARANSSAIGHLAAAGRIYLSNRVLEDGRYGIQRYVPVPADRLWSLQEAHQAVARVCLHAACAMDALAAEAGAPSTILAVIRPAAPSTDIDAELAALEDCNRCIRRPKGSRRRHTSTTLVSKRDVNPVPPDPAPRRAAADYAAAPDRVTTPTPYGPVERRLRADGVTDFGLLLQAAAIDRAGRNLLDRASAPDGENRDRPRQSNTASRNPATLAAADGPIGGPSAREARCSDNGPAAEPLRPSPSAATPEVGKTTPHRSSRLASALRAAPAAVPTSAENHRPGRVAPRPTRRRSAS